MICHTPIEILNLRSTQDGEPKRTKKLDRYGFRFMVSIYGARFLFGPDFDPNLEIAEK